MGWENVLDEQIDLKRFWRSREGQRFAYGFLMDVAGKHPDVEQDVMESFRGFIGREVHKLDIADPVYVAPPVCQLIAAASKAEPPFEPEPLLPADLPCPYGYLRFDQPMVLLDAKDEPVNICAISWMPVVKASYIDKMGTDAGAPWEEQGIHLTMYSDMEHPEDVSAQHLRAECEGRGVGAPPKILMLHQMPWWFGEDYHPDRWDIGEGQVATAAENMMRWFALMQVTFRILQQKITSSGKTRLPKGFRKRAEREGYDPYTKVVTLRRYEAKGTGEYSEGDEPYYSHRFLVEGHWRRQWYPSLQEHRQIWIDTFVKGPEDGELIVKPNRAIEVVR